MGIKTGVTVRGYCLPVKVFAIGLLLALVAVAGFILGGCDAGEDAVGENEIRAERAEKALEATVDYYREHRSSPQSWWDLVALRGAEVDLNDVDWEVEFSRGSETADLFKKLLDSSSPTDYAGAILGALALEKDLSVVFPEKDPVQELRRMQEEDGGFGGTVNNSIWALIALEAVSAEGFAAESAEDAESDENTATNTAIGKAAKAVDYLLQEQKEDGGFALRGDSGDPDVTAMVLQALAPYAEMPGMPEVSRSIDKALSFLQEKQLQTGGFASFGEENANSVAVVISGLLAVDEDPLDPKWQKEGQEGFMGLPRQKVAAAGDKSSTNMVESLLRFQLEDGSFSYLLEPLNSNPMATSQALVTLGDLAAGETVFSRMSRD